MTIRKLVLLAAAAALSGCASTNDPAADQSASLQKALYVSGDGGATQKLNAVDQSPAAAQGASKVMRIYWFLGGR